MAISESQLRELITESFPDADFKIDDLAGDGDHYALTIKSAEFKGKTRVQQHKMVFDALKGAMNEELHALAIKTEVI